MSETRAHARLVAGRFGENEIAMTDYADCRNQRNLTDGGGADARSLGAAGFHLVARIPKDGWDGLAAP